MILAVGNAKGGVGTTTIAVNLAVARALAGRDVWLADGDARGTAQIALRARFAANREPGPACSAYPDGSVLRAQVNQQKRKHDDVIIDAGAGTLPRCARR